MCQHTYHTVWLSIELLDRTDLMILETMTFYILPYYAVLDTAFACSRRNQFELVLMSSSVR